MKEHPPCQNQLASPPRGLWRSRAGIALLVFLAVGGLLLVYEHRVHLSIGHTVLVLLLILCVGMYFFVHFAGDGDGEQKEDASEGKRQ